MGRTAEESFSNVIEHRSAVDKALVVGSFAADLAHTSSAQMVIGTSSSIVSWLIFLNCVGHLGRVPPFVWLDRPFGHTFASPTPIALP